MPIAPDKLALMLVDGASFLVDQKIPRHNVERFDDLLGRYIAHKVERLQYEQDDVDRTGNILFLHCGKGVLQRYCTEVEKLGYTTAYDFNRADVVKDRYPALEDCPLIDVYELAHGGRVLEWLPGWCPFRNAAEVLWVAGWKGMPPENPSVLDARKFLEKLQADLKRRANPQPSEPLAAIRLQ